MGQETEPKSFDVIRFGEGSTDIESQQNRVVVYGSNISGAADFTVRFQQFLNERGIQNPTVQLVRFTNDIVPSFFGVDYPEQTGHLPRGVVVFPQMRYETHDGYTMFVPMHGMLGRESDEPTVFDQIKAMCDEHNVPIIRFDVESRVEQELRELAQIRPAIEMEK